MARTQTFLNGEIGLSIRNKINSLADWSGSYTYNTNDITHYGGYAFASAVDNNLGNHPSSSVLWKSLAETSSFAISASWAPHPTQVSASYAPVEPMYSSSAAAYINTKQDTLTNTLYVITASIATSASYVANLYPQTLQVSSSWASSSISASYVISASSAPAPDYTSSLYGTASWANKAINADTASISNGVSIAVNTYWNNTELNIAGGACKLGGSGAAQFGEGTVTIDVNGNIVATTITASLKGTASVATSASFAKSASYATTSSYAVTSSNATLADFVNFDDRNYRLTNYNRTILKTNLVGPPDGVSGVTYSPITNTIYCIRNVTGGASAVYEYDLYGNALRTITETGAWIDTEAISWCSGSTFAIVEENIAVSTFSRIHIVDINAIQTTVNFSSGSIYNTNITQSNLGVEGVNYDPDRNCVYYTTEKSSTGNNTTGVWNMWRLDLSGSAVPGAITALWSLITKGFGAVSTDCGDMHFDRDSQRFYLLGQESNIVVRTDYNGNILDTMAVAGMAQPEGISLTPDRQSLFISGEPLELSVFHTKWSKLPRFNSTASYASNAATASIAVTASAATSITFTPASASYANTASYVSQSVIGDGIFRIESISSASYAALSPPLTTTLYIISGSF